MYNICVCCGKIIPEGRMVCPTCENSQNFVMNKEIPSLELKVTLDPGAYLPKRAHPNDAGLDLYAMERKYIPGNSYASLDTGVHVQIPVGFVGMITSKSGLMANHGITCRGTIDSGYTGSIRAVLFNHSGTDYIVEKGQKITQLVLVPIITPDPVVVDSLEDTERGSGGFGSTGKF